MDFSEQFIRRTFELARQGLGLVAPNPLVGAVIVKDGRVIGEGFHERYGQDHAEVSALKACLESPRGATLFVNLEPCCHTRKQTPPCAQRLIQEGISKVVICNLDPNPEVNGKGVALLRSAGISVEHGVLEAEGEILNEVFFHAQRTGRPFVHLKLAMTLDGRIALPSGESQWITGTLARSRVHELRSQHQAIAVGGQTVRTDDPQLTVRLPDYSGPQPLRIVFTKSGELPPRARVFSPEFAEGTRIFGSGPHPGTLAHLSYTQTASLTEALKQLFEEKITNLFLECGPALAAAFMRENLVDRVSLFINPSFLGAGPSSMGPLHLLALANRPRLSEVSSEWVGDDLYLTGRLAKGS